MKVLLLSVVILISSCCDTQYIVKPLPVPPPITLPNEAELSCLSDEAYKKVVGMDKRIFTLLGIIESTHE
jgi:hypothetical protein